MAFRGPAGQRLIVMSNIEGFEPWPTAGDDGPAPPHVKDEFGVPSELEGTPMGEYLQQMEADRRKKQVDGFVLLSNRMDHAVSFHSDMDRLQSGKTTYARSERAAA